MSVSGTREWEQQPGEPDKSFERFDRYFLPVVPDRSIEGAFKRCEAAATGGGWARPSGWWYTAANRSR